MVIDTLPEPASALEGHHNRLAPARRLVRWRNSLLDKLDLVACHTTRRRGMPAILRVVGRGQYMEAS